MSPINFFRHCKGRILKPPTASTITIPDWKQHPQNHAQYPFNEFKQDWGPGGQWGIVKTYKIYGASNCPGGGTGVVIDAIVNDRAQHAQVYVDKSDKTISSPPCDLEFR